MFQPAQHAGDQETRIGLAGQAADVGDELLDVGVGDVIAHVIRQHVEQHAAGLLGDLFPLEPEKHE